MITPLPPSVPWAPHPVWWLRVGLLALSAIGLWAVALTLWARLQRRNFVAGAAVSVASGLALSIGTSGLLFQSGARPSLWSLSAEATHSLLRALLGLGLALIAFGILALLAFLPRAPRRPAVANAGPVRSAALPPRGRRLFSEVFAPPMIAGAVFPFGVLLVAWWVNATRHGGEAFLAKSFTAILVAWLLMAVGVVGFFLWGVVRSTRRVGMRGVQEIGTALLCGLAAAATVVAVGLPALLVFQRSVR